MKNGNKASRKDDFIAPARRALRRAARKVQAENRRLGLPLIVLPAGKTAKARA